MVELRDESGLSLVEVLVAAVVLVAGTLAAFSLIDRANESITVNNARTGSTNLARELVEYARGTDYGNLQPGPLIAAMQARTGGSGSPWTVARRGVTYTVEASVCTFDDPKDGLAAAAPDNPCPSASAIAGTAVDENGDDFRRVTFTVTWTVRSKPGSARQSALIANPTGGLGPRITSFMPTGSEVTSDAVTSWSPAQLVSEPAAGVRWIVDNVSQGDATGGPTSWSFSWPLGTPKLAPVTVDGTWVVDGTYWVQAQAMDDRGIPGEKRVASVRVNRHAPGTVPSLAGGFNLRHGGVVDIRWQRYPESDVLGYRVERSDGTVVTVVCGPSGGDEWRQTSCRDASPPDGEWTYSVYAVDCAPPSLTSCTPRKGVAGVLPPITVDRSPSAPAPPPAPVGVTVTQTAEGNPQLVWDAPATSGVLFYRIYRQPGTVIDGSGLQAHYAETLTNEPHYTDPEPLSSTATYWVTAVDAAFNESEPSDPKWFTP